MKKKDRLFLGMGSEPEEEEDDALTEETARTKAEKRKFVLQHWHAGRRVLRAVLERYRLHTTYTTTQLRFEKKNNDDQRIMQEKTTVLSDLFSQGALAPVHLQRHLQQVWGDDGSLQLRELPEPPAKAAGTKRKAGASSSKRPTKKAKK